MLDPHCFQSRSADLPYGDDYTITSDKSLKHQSGQHAGLLGGTAARLQHLEPRKSCADFVKRHGAKWVLIDSLAILIIIALIGESFIEVERLDIKC